MFLNEIFELCYLADCHQPAQADTFSVTVHTYTLIRRAHCDTVSAFCVIVISIALTKYPNRINSKRCCGTRTNVHVEKHPSHTFREATLAVMLLRH